MRIVYSTSARIPSRAANAVQSLKMCDALAGLGHAVRMHCRPGDDVDDVGAAYGLRHRFAVAPISTAAPRGLRTLAFEARLRRASREAQPGLYFSRDVYALCGVATTGVPLLLELHRTMEGHAVEEQALSWLVRQPSLAAVVVVSHGMARWYRERFGVSAVVEPGAADDRGDVAAVASPGARAGALQLGYVGHLYAGRGVEVLAAVAARCKDVDVHVVGGDDKDVARCRAAHALPNLHFHGHLPHAALPARLAGFDVLLAPYQRQVWVQGGAETSAVMSPLKLFEYMAAGRAIICSDLPVLREVLDDDRAALVAPDDVDAWVAAVDALRDARRRRALGAAARARFVERHTWTARARRLLALVPPR